MDQGGLEMYYSSKERILQVFVYRIYLCNSASSILLWFVFCFEVMLMFHKMRTRNKVSIVCLACQIVNIVPILCRL